MNIFFATISEKRGRNGFFKVSLQRLDTNDRLITVKMLDRVCPPGGVGGARKWKSFFFCLFPFSNEPITTTQSPPSTSCATSRQHARPRLLILAKMQRRARQLPTEHLLCNHQFHICYPELLVHVLNPSLLMSLQYKRN